MNVVKGCIASVIVYSLTACAVSTVPISEQEFIDNANSHQEKLTGNQEILKGPVDLYEAMARALKYNLDFQVEIYEHALRIDEHELSKMDMLPDIVASANMSDRNNDSGGRSLSLLSGTESLEPSTSSDRDQLSYDLNLSWNILDFGLSYVRAKQAGDRALIAMENRRRVASKIIEDVRTAYWRAVTSAKLIGELRSLEAEVDSAIEESRKLELSGSASPMDALFYQRDMFSVKLQIKTLHKDFAVAKKQLAALMNVDPGSSLELVMPDTNDLSLPDEFTAENLVSTALAQRSEIRELAYKRRISEKEATAAVLSMLPGIQLFAGVNTDTNDLIYNNNWQNWGAKVSWNLLEVFSYPKNKRVVESEIKMLEEQSRAMAMAIVTQVHISLQRFNLQNEEYFVSKEYANIQSKIDSNATASKAAQRTSNQFWIRERMNTIISRLKSDIAYASLQNAYANVFAASGRNAVPAYGSAQGVTVDELSHKLRKFWTEL